MQYRFVVVRRIKVSLLARLIAYVKILSVNIRYTFKENIYIFFSTFDSFVYAKEMGDGYFLECSWSNPSLHVAEKPILSKNNSDNNCLALFKKTSIVLFEFSSRSVLSCFIVFFGVTWVKH
jgi:hypothetical protein